MSRWHAEQLVELIRQRYPEWDGFEHLPFVADEIAPKQKLVEKAQLFLAQEPLDALLNDGAFDDIIAQLEKLTRQTNLLWRRVPKQGDTAVFQAPTLNKPQFAIQIRNLLHGDRTVGERLQTFADYLDSEQLPNKWPLPTFLLYVVHPETELLVRPKPARWLLKFMGSTNNLSKTPTADEYDQLVALAATLRQSLAAYQPTNMLDIQSAIWIGMRESKKQVGSLNRRAQVDLDVPPTEPLAAVGYDVVETAVSLQEPTSPYKTKAEPYTIEQMVTETGYSADEITQWQQAAQRKGQLIIYGPPGTGKTFVAQKLARLLAAPDGFVELLQFHPGYSYEDFIEGLRPLPTQDGDTKFVRQSGRFLQFCEKAAQHDGDCVLIIDEINRANVTAVLGELMFLLEYRGQTIPLASGTPFKIPQNVKIIATMNSADRSLALVDFALRRRFAFIPFAPKYDLIRQAHPDSTVNVDQLMKLLEEINSVIDDPNYAIGHTYFLTDDLASALEQIWQLEIVPFLSEYFLDATQIISKYHWNKIQNKL